VLSFCSNLATKKISIWFGERGSTLSELIYSNL
jgi:hypothetical protein